MLILQEKYFTFIKVKQNRQPSYPYGGCRKNNNATEGKGKYHFADRIQIRG